MYREQFVVAVFVNLASAVKYLAPPHPGVYDS